MQFRAKHALLLFCLAGIHGGLAQQKTETSNAAYGIARPDSNFQGAAKPLTLEEGLAIISAALDSRHHAAFKSDCSHFVHGLYQRAGFPYAYAPSSNLYAGLDEFRRVTHPQPGDLAVWPGHAGIVINPAEHSFFSLLRSGPGVDRYDSPYWKKKGRPRFFRYVKAVQGGALSSSNRAANLTPTALDDTEPREPAEEQPVPEISEALSSDTQPSARLPANPSLSGTIPQVPVVRFLHPKPDQVSAAFLQSCAESESMLRGRNLFKSSQALIVFDHFAVKKVHIAGNHNWAEVEIAEVGSLASGTADTQKRSERQRWPLIPRDRASWELTIPRNTIYLPQHLAVRLLAQQLAQLTKDSSDIANSAQEKPELARLLDTLLRQ
jgi:hypothetical protein